MDAARGVCLHVVGGADHVIRRNGVDHHVVVRIVNRVQPSVKHVPGHVIMLVAGNAEVQVVVVSNRHQEDIGTVAVLSPALETENELHLRKDAKHPINDDDQDHVIATNQSTRNKPFQ